MKKERATITAKGLLALVCSFLMVCQPVWGAPPPVPIGRVSGGGPVQLNGIAAPTGTIVYAGNRIETGAAGVSYIALSHGGRLVIGASSSALITKNPKSISVKLDRGVLGAVSEAKTPIVVTAAGVIVRTKQAKGVYEVALEGTSLKVLADHGTAIAEAPSRTVEVPQGKEMDAAVKQGSALTAGQQLALAGLIAAGITGIGLGVALGTENNKTCVSAGQVCQ